MLTKPQYKSGFLIDGDESSSFSSHIRFWVFSHRNLNPNPKFSRRIPTALRHWKRRGWVLQIETAKGDGRNATTYACCSDVKSFQASSHSLGSLSLSQCFLVYPSFLAAAFASSGSSSLEKKRTEVAFWESRLACLFALTNSKSISSSYLPVIFVVFTTHGLKRFTISFWNCLCHLFLIRSNATCQCASGTSIFVRHQLDLPSVYGSVPYQVRYVV